jgi:probable phosphoglycerate mutase
MPLPDIWLVRHGATEWSEQWRHTGRTDLALTEEGVRQAASLARPLDRERFDVVLASPKARVRETARLAGFADAVVDDDLVEWNYGDYEGLTTEQIREKVPNWTVWTHPIPHGEGAEQVGKRASKLLDRVASAMREGDVVLVGHGHFSRVLVSRWLELSASDGVRFGMDPAGTTVLGSERGERQVVRSNVPPWPV